MKINLNPPDIVPYIGGGCSPDETISEQQARIAELETALKIAYRFFGKDETDDVKRNEVRGIIARALGHK